MAGDGVTYTKAIRIMVHWLSFRYPLGKMELAKSRDVHLVFTTKFHAGLQYAPCEREHSYKPQGCCWYISARVCLSQGMFEDHAEDNPILAQILAQSKPSLPLLLLKTNTIGWQ